MDNEQIGFAKFIFEQGVGVAFGVVCLLILIFTTRSHTKDKNDTITRLQDLLRERKADRDKQLELMAKIESHLSSAKAIEAVAKLAIQETLNWEGPRRRVLDDRIAKAFLEEDR